MKQVSVSGVVKLSRNIQRCEELAFHLGVQGEAL